MEYEPEIVNKITHWLEFHNFGAKVDFKADVGSFIVKPDGEKYEIEIPFLQAKKMLETNGQSADVESLKAEQWLDEAMEEMSDEECEDDGCE